MIFIFSIILSLVLYSRIIDLVSDIYTMFQIYTMFHIFLPYKMICVVNIYHCTKILQCYISVPIYYIPMNYFIIGSLYLLISFIYFTQPPIPLFFDNYHFVLCIIFYFVRSVHLFCSLDSTCKRNYTLSFSV